MTATVLSVSLKKTLTHKKKNLTLHTHPNPHTNPLSWCAIFSREIHPALPHLSKHWLMLIMRLPADICHTFTFSRHFDPKRLTISPFVRRRRNNNTSVGPVRMFIQVSSTNNQGQPISCTQQGYVVFQMPRTPPSGVELILWRNFLARSTYNVPVTYWLIIVSYISLFSKARKQTQTSHCIAHTARPCNATIGEQIKAGI